MTERRRIHNFIDGGWRPSDAVETLRVANPATGEAIAETPLGGAADVAAAVESASRAFPAWRQTPPEERIQYLFRLKQLLEDHVDDLARLITIENGKTLTEARAEVRRSIENVEVACGIPTLMQGYNLEDVARGIDEIMIRQPLGVVAAVTPFNFPLMVPLWFLPYAIACGNTFVLKPSERVPVTIELFSDIMQRTGLPPGVFNVVNGGKAAVDAILDHPEIRGVSFVGSTPVARYLYSRGAANGKRVQCQGGAKNHVVILPDADLEMTTQIIADSAFGCAGQRCLAVSTAITVGAAKEPFREALLEAAGSIRVGFGLDEGIQMGPVITPESKTRIESLIDRGLQAGAKILLDGRAAKIDGREAGNFIKPTVIDEVSPDNAIADTELFGPVLSLVHAEDVDQALEILGRSKFGNAASIFTASGAAARKFRYQAPAGNIGVNIGVAAPMAYFPFSGWKDSFLGVLHGQGRDAVEFYTDKKVVIERWPKEWSRRF